jgi:hypothetical protein
LDGGFPSLKPWEGGFFSYPIAGSQEFRDLSHLGEFEGFSAKKSAPMVDADVR